jgi:hypothetical protein
VLVPAAGEGELFRRLSIVGLFELLVTWTDSVTDDPRLLVLLETAVVFDAAAVFEFACAAAAAAAAAADAVKESKIKC